MEPSPHKPLLFALFKRTSRPVFIGSAMILFGMIVFVLRDPFGAEATFQSLQSGVTAAFGWVYRYTMTAVLLFSLLMLGSRHGGLRLGDPASTPSFKRMSCFAMMFGAGDGDRPAVPERFGTAGPFREPAHRSRRNRGRRAARHAFDFFHWGLHARAVYAVVAAITALGTWALVRRLDKGIEAVTRLNIAIAGVLLVTVLLLVCVGVWRAVLLKESSGRQADGRQADAEGG